MMPFLPTGRSVSVIISGTLSRELKPKRGGERYRVSPGKLLWNNDNYYLMGLDESSGIVKHYRVDKMMDVAVEEEKRSGESVFRDFDMGDSQQRPLVCLTAKKRF